MRRLLALGAVLLTATACGGATTDSGSVEAPNAPVVATTVAPAPVPDASGSPAEPAVEAIRTPEPSGDPDLDALGSELDGLDQEFNALDAAIADPQGTNP